ncbi:MAG: polyprenol monophosphomannose synthase [Chloroflexota bacterium]
MKIGIIVPTYNECENIVALLNQLLDLPIEADIIVVDDNSPDGTSQIVETLKATSSNIHLIQRPRKLGLGTAHIAGIKYALAHNAEYVLTMDADFSHHPRYIPAMLEMAEMHHVTIGSRYVPGGGVENWGIHRRFLSATANRIARIGLGLKANDCTAGFRCYHREVLLKLDLDNIFSNGYSFLLEMAYKCKLLRCSFGETPIIFVNRAHGTSKISQNEIFKAIYTVLRLALTRPRFWYPKPTPVSPLRKNVSS